MKAEEEVEKTLIESPDLIAGSERKVLGFSNNISTTEAEINEIEQWTMAKIANELNQEGKKLYKNEAARNGELSKELFKRKDYNEKKKEINFMKNELAKEKIKLTYLQNRFSAAKYLTRLYSQSEE